MKTHIDFLRLLAVDVVLKILMCLHDPADIIRASKIGEILVASIAYLTETTYNSEPASDDPPNNTLERKHMTYASLFWACTSFPLRYWSSKGHDDPEVPETLIYYLGGTICVITQIDITPFQALFQEGNPIYSARFVRFRMGHPKSKKHIDLNFIKAQECADDKFVWTYTSQTFQMVQESRLQKFTLPEPVLLCLGGFLQIELLGRVQKKQSDGKYYICPNVQPNTNIPIPEPTVQHEHPPANPLQPTTHTTNAPPTPPTNTEPVNHLPHSPTLVSPSAHTQSLTHTPLPAPSDTTHPTTHAVNPTQTVSMHLMVTRAKAGIFKPLEHMNDGSLSRYKARLVPNGRSQQQGIDCDETFSSVVKPATIRTVLSLAVSRDWPIHQLNVKNDFLHGHLSETVYMHQPPEFVDSARPNYFAMTYLGSFNYFLGISASGLFLSLSKFAEEILEKAHMQHCNPCKTPVDNESKLGPYGDPVSNSTLYRSLACALQYLIFTRPDISYVVQQVCLYMHDPREPHLAALKRIIRYVPGCAVTRRSTSGYSIFLGDNLLSWSAKQHVTVFRSSAETEYRGVANVVIETAWIRNLLLELHAPLRTATLVYCDDISVVYLSTKISSPRVFRVPYFLIFVPVEHSHLPLANVLHTITIKLSSTNYLIWKNKMMPLLAYQKLTCYVDGFIPMSSSTIASGDIKK
ncbi:ribonuclease H-like domain-containing protein [Tanacetum coccineum]